MRMADFLRDARDTDIQLPVDHLSASQVNMLTRCPEQWRQRYVLGKKERPGAALVVGGAFHKALENDFATKIEAGQLLPTETVLESYNWAFDERVEEAGGVNEVVWDEREKPDVARKHGQACVEQYHTQVAPKLEPENVEYEFSKEVPGIPVPVHGVIDFIGHRPLDSPATVIKPFPLAADYKTASRAQRTIKPAWRFQGETYQWASGRPVEWHVAVKSSKPSIITPLEAPALFQPIEDGMGWRSPVTEFVERQYTVAARKIAWFMREWGPDEPWPLDGYWHEWACGFCGYKPECVAWKKP